MRSQPARQHSSRCPAGTLPRARGLLPSTARACAVPSPKHRPCSRTCSAQQRNCPPPSLQDRIAPQPGFQSSPATNLLASATQKQETISDGSHGTGAESPPPEAGPAPFHSTPPPARPPASSQHEPSANPRNVSSSFQQLERRINIPAVSSLGGRAGPFGAPPPPVSGSLRRRGRLRAGWRQRRWCVCSC